MDTKAPRSTDIDMMDDDEPEVVYESSPRNSRKLRSRRTKLEQPKLSGHLSSSNPVLIEGIPTENVPEVNDSAKLNQTIYLSDSDDDVKLETENSVDSDVDVCDEPLFEEDKDHRRISEENNMASRSQPFRNNQVLPLHNSASLDAESTSKDIQADAMSVDEEIEDVTPPELLRAARLRQAEELKELGNQYFVAKDYHKALELYTKAIELIPEPSFYGNRSACYIMLRKYKLAQADARTAIQMDPLFTNGYLRLLRANLSLGDTVGADSVIAYLKESNLKGKFDFEERRLVTLKAVRKEMNTLKERKDYRTLLFHCERALAIADGDMELKMIKADTLLKLNRAPEAQELCTEVLQLDSRCVDAYYIRSICLYNLDNLDKAIQFLKQALQFAPDSTLIVNFFRRTKKLKEVREEAASLFSKGNYAEARVKFMECIESVKAFEYPNSMIESKMSLNLSLIATKLGELDEALTTVNRAIELNPSYLKAHLHRAHIHKTKEMFNEAVADYEAAQKLDSRNTEYRKYIQEMKLAAKKALRKDYYKILGVDKNASQDDVKKAYKKRALIHHPDRHSSASETVQKEQEKQFKELGQAYEVLSDPKKRNRYDAGHDLLDSPDSGFGRSDFDASNLFNVFFSGGGMGYPRSSGGFQQQQHRTYGNFHPY